MSGNWWRHPAVSLLAAAVIGGILALAVALAVSPGHVTKGPPTEPMAISLADLPDRPLIPMLDRAAMQLSGLTIAVGGRIPVIVATYRGLHGCRLELRSYQAGAKVAPLAGTSHHRWNVGDSDYELVAHGMAAARFELIADGAKRQTRPNPDSAVIDRQLRRARTPAMPCKD